MNNKFYKKFEDFLSNFDLTDKQYNVIFNLYDKLEKENEKDVLDYIELCNALDNYNYKEFKEELEDIVDFKIEEENNIQESIKEDIEEDEFEDEEIDEVEEKASNLRNLFSNKKEETNETPQEEEEEVEVVDLDLDEMIDEVPAKKTGGIFNFFKNLFSKKESKEDPELEDEDIERVDLEEETIEEVKENDPYKNLKKTTKLDEIKIFIYKNKFDNDEILDCINLITFREDQKIIIDSLYDYIQTEDAKDINKFTNKLYELFGMKKKEEDKKEEVKEDKKEIIVVEPKKEEIIEIQKNETVELTDYEKEIISDLKAENINVNDAEFNQFISERAVNKDKIKAYLTNTKVDEVKKEDKKEIKVVNTQTKEITKKENIVRKEKNIEAARENKRYYITIYDAASTIVKKQLENIKPTTKQEKQQVIETALNKFYTQISTRLSETEAYYTRQLIDNYKENRVKIDYELEKIKEQDKKIELIEKNNKLSNKVSMYAKQLPNLENKLDITLAKYNEVLKNAPKRSEYTDKKAYDKDYAKYESLVIEKPKAEYEKALNEYKKITNRMANASQTIINSSEKTSKITKEEALENIDKHMDIIIALGYKGKDFNQMKQNAKGKVKVLSL